MHILNRYTACRFGTPSFYITKLRETNRTQHVTIIFNVNQILHPNQVILFGLPFRGWSLYFAPQGEGNGWPTDRVLKPARKLLLVVTFVLSESAFRTGFKTLSFSQPVYSLFAADEGTNPKTAGRTAIENI